jgi:hypothetical protein
MASKAISATLPRRAIGLTIIGLQNVVKKGGMVQPISCLHAGQCLANLHRSMVPVPPEPGKVNCWTAWARQFGSSIIRCARNEHTSIGLSDSSVAHRMRHPAKMAELEKDDLFLSFARHRGRQHSRFAGNLRVAVLGAEHGVIRSPDDGKRSPVEVY